MEYHRYTVCANYIVSVCAEVIARDEYEAEELFNDNIELVEYANETVGPESSSELVEVQSCSTDNWQEEITNIEEGEALDFDDLLDLGLADWPEDEDVDESYKVKTRAELAKLIEYAQTKGASYKVKRAPKSLGESYRYVVNVKKEALTENTHKVIGNKRIKKSEREQEEGLLPDIGNAICTYCRGP